MEKWRKSLIPIINKLRNKLQEVPIYKLAERSGAQFEEDAEKGILTLSFFNQQYKISYPQITVTNRKRETCKEEIQVILLNYLSNADGTPISGEWLGFRELPNGDFYYRAFQSYSGDKLSRSFKDQLGKFSYVCENLNGEPLSFGDQAYSFRVLPRVKLACVYWLGGEEFPDKANVLFDGSASHYLSTDGLAQLGRLLTDMLIRGKEELENDEDSRKR